MLSGVNIYNYDIKPYYNKVGLWKISQVHFIILYYNMILILCQGVDKFLNIWYNKMGISLGVSYD